MDNYDNLSIEELEQKESILAASYWENFKYIKDIEKSMKPTSPKMKNLINELNLYSKEWNELKNYIKKREAEGL